MEFINYNANPKNKKTGDCVIRAISTALNQDYWKTLDEMVEVTKKTGYYMSYKNGFEAYLKSKGYEKQKMPKRPDNTRYTVEEFADELAMPCYNYILNVANHLTCLKGQDLYDIWNCSRKSVGNYWIISKDKNPKIKVEL